MLIATFGRATGWAGKTIRYENGRFVLAGFGQITAHDVLMYDGQGHLEWPHAGMREWVQATSAGQRTPPPRRRASTWVVVLMVITAVIVLTPFVVGYFIPTSMVDDQEGQALGTAMEGASNHETTEAREAAVKEGIRSLQAGVEAWAADHEGVYPDPSVVSLPGFESYVGAWPNNPYDDLPRVPA